MRRVIVIAVLFTACPGAYEQSYSHQGLRLLFRDVDFFVNADFWGERRTTERNRNYDGAFG
jgi:hypothetical protein